MNSKKLTGIRGIVCLILFYYSGWVLGGLLVEPIPQYEEIFSDKYIGEPHG